MPVMIIVITLYYSNAEKTLFIKIYDCLISGKCVVDYTEKGWFVQYIDRDPETIKKQEQTKAKEKMDMDDEERTASLIQKQIKRAAEQGTVAKDVEYTELKRESEEEKGE